VCAQSQNIEVFVAVIIGSLRIRAPSPPSRFAQMLLTMQSVRDALDEIKQALQKDTPRYVIPAI
jgi:hypothetical protein